MAREFLYSFYEHSLPEKLELDLCGIDVIQDSPRMGSPERPQSFIQLQRFFHENSDVIRENLGKVFDLDRRADEIAGDECLADDFLVVFFGSRSFFMVNAG